MAGRSNYFYCVRVTDPQVRANVQKALDWIVDKDPQYGPFCYTPEMIHVTLCEVALNSEEDIKRASAALQDIAPSLRRILPKSTMTIKGITTFFDKVMVAQVEYEQDFGNFVEEFKLKIKGAGVTVVEKHAFNPHLTMMKVNTARARKAKVEDINPWLYVHLKKELFGDQRVDNIHLSQMGYGRRDDGFYVTPGEYHYDTY